jgi:hypothetical protein
VPGAAKVVMTYAFSETLDGGTHIEIRVANPKPRKEAFFTQFGLASLEILKSELATSKVILEGDKGPQQRSNSHPYRHGRDVS